MTTSNSLDTVVIICTTQRRSRWTAYEKQQMVQKAYHPDVTVSYIARKHSISPSKLFYWRKLMEDVAMTGGQTEVVIAF